MSFLELKTRDESKIVRLNIVSDSLEVIPDMNITITDMSKNSQNWRFKHFFSNGYGGVSFKCTAIFDKRATMNGVHYSKNQNEDYPVASLIHEWYLNQEPLLVATDAMDLVFKNDYAQVVNGLFLITKNPTRKQTSENYSRWELEFTEYEPLTVVQFKNSNAAVKKALQTAKQKKLSECDFGELVFSKKKNKKGCVELLQKQLQSMNFYIGNQCDGWFYESTLKAVKNYQSTEKLKVTGKVDNATFKKLCGITNSKSSSKKKKK